MEISVEQAVGNNARWCEIVCRAHGRPGEFLDEIWINRAPLPRYYPNAQTLAKRGSRPIELIKELVHEPLPPGWAVKDSFASLDLAGCGFSPLFDAQWIYLSGERLETIRPTAAPDLQWQIVHDDGLLAEWEDAWCAAQRDTNRARVFLPALLENREVAMVAARRGGRIIAGAIGNNSDGVVGWSNLFAKESRDLRDGAVGSLLALSEIFPGLPMVGYEGGDALRDAVSLGFQAIGPLRVWIFSAAP